MQPLQWTPWRLLAEPPVQHLPYLQRVAAHAGVWVLWLLGLQYLLLATVSLLHRHHLPRSAKPVKLHWARMLAEDVAGYSAWVWPIALLAAWLNPGAQPGGWAWDYSCPNLLALGYYAQATLMAYDAYSFFLHRWMHQNKTAFRLMHAKHHEQRAALDVTTSGYMSFNEGCFSSALPMVLLYGLGLRTGSWWYTLAGLWNSMHIVMTGHCGHKCSLGDVRDLPLLALNPFALWYETMPVRATPMEHEDHHNFPTRNFAFFYTFWDDVYNTRRHPEPACSVLVLACHAVWQAMILGSIYLFASHLQLSALVWAAAYVVCSPGVAYAVSEALNLPEVARRCFGWLMDAYRADSFITYAEPGSPGAFDAAAAAADAVAAAADGAQQQAQQEQQQQPRAPVFVFGVHPVGVLSRAAFCTFGARGWRSPVSKLAKVRFAVSSQLLALPIAGTRELLLACGCMPADRAAVRCALRAGCSVAVTPGGWREGGHINTLNLVLAKRRGFVAAAAETGAALVPVLALGEQDVGGEREPGWWWVKRLQAQRPHPVKVVFGKPLACRAGESVEQLHSRYTEALLALGKQHGAALTVVE